MADAGTRCSTCGHGPHPRYRCYEQASPTDKAHIFCNCSVDAPAPAADGGEILAREEYAERINDAYFDQGMGMATHDVLLHHDAALRARAERSEAELKRWRDEADRLREYDATIHFPRIDALRSEVERLRGKNAALSAILARRRRVNETVTIGVYRCPKHRTFWSVAFDDRRITPSKCCGTWDLVKEWKGVTLE